MNAPKHPKREAKKAYRPPRLVKYGEVRTLTQSGSAGGAENVAMPAANKMASDRALKENIVRIGEHPLGFGLYLFDFKPAHRAAHGEGRQFGVMAQEVESVAPQAVGRDAAGHAVVDYAALGISRTRR
jgi:hypothetical protein